VSKPGKPSRPGQALPTADDLWPTAMQPTIQSDALLGKERCTNSARPRTNGDSPRPVPELPSTRGAQASSARLRANRARYIEELSVAQRWL